MKYFIGPELIWLIFFIVAKWLANLNKATNHPLDEFINQCWFWVPLLAFLTFGLYWVSGIEKSWLMLRIWVVCLFFGNHILESLMSAYSQQGPGIGMGYLAGILFTFIILIAGSIFVKIVN